MSEENNVVAEQPEVDIHTLMAENEKLKADLKTVADHKDKLYQETKKAKADRENAEKESKRIADEKAQKNGEFEELYKSKHEEAETYKKQFEEYKRSVRNDKLQANALRIATELADGDNAELLSEFVKRKLDTLAEEDGTLSADIINDLKKEFATNMKYKSLLRGSKASGGNAVGNPKGKADSAKEISRADFDKLDAQSKSQFFKNSGKITD